MRAVLRFVRWTLTVLTSEDGHPPVFSAVCSACHDASIGYARSEKAQDWCLEHAGKTGHESYRLVIESWAVATQATPAP